MMLSLPSRRRRTCSAGCPRRITRNPRQRVWLEASQRYVEPDVNVMRERRERPIRGSEHGGVALAEPEVETDLEVAQPVVITVEERHP